MHVIQVVTVNKMTHIEKATIRVKQKEKIKSKYKTVGESGTVFLYCRTAADTVPVTNSVLSES